MAYFLDKLFNLKKTYDKNFGFTEKDRGYVLLLNDEELTLDDLEVLKKFALDKNYNIISIEESLAKLKKDRNHFDPEDSMIADLIMDRSINQKLIEMVKYRIAGYNEPCSLDEIEYSAEKITEINNKLIDGFTRGLVMDTCALIRERDNEVCLIGEVKYGMGSKKSEKEKIKK